WSRKAPPAKRPTSSPSPSPCRAGKAATIAPPSAPTPKSAATSPKQKSPAASTWSITSSTWSTRFGNWGSEPIRSNGHGRFFLRYHERVGRDSGNGNGSGNRGHVGRDSAAGAPPRREACAAGRGRERRRGGGGSNPALLCPCDTGRAGSGLA